VSRPDVLAVAKLHPFYRQALDSLYTVHDRTHETDPQAFAALAPRILGVAGTGEALVPGSLLRQLPQARVVSVFGVGYDGVDVATALARGVPVTHTPGVLTDDVADLALGLVLSVARQIPLADQHVRARPLAARSAAAWGARSRAHAWALWAWAASARPLPAGRWPLA
jgi:hydroxypyruvate reductase